MRDEFEKVVWVEHESDVLKGNPLGDPHVRRFPVYVPPDYDANPEKRYPVMYMLIGFTGAGHMYLYRRFLRDSMPDILDDLTLNAGMPGVICVFPDCLTSLGGSQYVNSSATGRYEDYLVDEIVPFIDSEFRTTGMRGCIGGSSGGIGSFIMSAKYPEVFQAFADHSGDSAFEYCYLGDVPKCVQALAKYDYKIEDFVRQIPEIQPKDDDFQILLNMAAMSACYAPNPDSPLGWDLPFDPYDGTLRPDVWEKFRAHDPVNMVEKYADNLRRLRFAFVDCGTKDQFHLFLGSRQLHRQLEAHGIEHVYEEYDSDHFSAALGAEEEVDPDDGERARGRLGQRV
ncbi:MAG TPA: alpha/beta hydrolase-fold protein [Dehalococcoidia bacterium]|nr:alpha/beta hydrolase-fold protein [Dehalococcoidia bacterium]